MGNDEIKNKKAVDPTTLPTFEKLHGKPVSRRDFLATGLIPFSATLILPSWLQMFASSGVAEAADLVCGAPAGSQLPSVITLKLSGGAGLAANWIPLDQGGQLLPSYSKIGLGTGSTLPITYAFGNNAPFYSNSGVLLGIQTFATSTTLAKAVFAGVPARSQDDSSGNKFDLSGMVAKSGLAGKILPNMGRANTDTGLNATYAFVKPPAPLVVSRFEDIAGSLGVNGSLATLNTPQKQKLFETIKGLTGRQVAAISGQSGGKLLGKLTECANIGNSNLISNANGLNISPLGNTAFADVWGINNNTNKGSQDFVFASMVFNALNGNAGSINLDIGGFDYHDGTRTSGDTKDRQAGEVIGKILQSFAVMGKKGMLVVCSDGGVSSPDSASTGTPWVSDRGTGGAMYMMAYDPSIKPEIINTQIGHFNVGQVADDTTLTGGSPEKAAAGIFANYLSWNGKLGLFESVAPRVFSTDELEKIVILKG